MDEKTKAFILWLSDPKSPFDTVFNGIDRTKPKISYRKGNSDKSWSIEEVWEYWSENIFAT